MGFVVGAGGVTRSTLAQAMVTGTVMASFAVEDFSVNGLLDLSTSVIDSRRESLVSMTHLS
jgi:hypothetical protein